MRNSKYPDFSRPQFLLFLGLFSATFILTSCSTVDQITGVTLDVSRVEQTIEDGVLQQGGFM